MLLVFPITVTVYFWTNLGFILPVIFLFNIKFLPVSLKPLLRSWKILHFKNLQKWLDYHIRSQLKTWRYVTNTFFCSVRNNIKTIENVSYNVKMCYLIIESNLHSKRDLGSKNSLYLVTIYFTIVLFLTWDMFNFNLSFVCFRFCENVLVRFKLFSEQWSGLQEIWFGLIPG